MAVSSSLQKKIGTYKPGSLRRIKLKDFVTYGNVTVEPGPRLNMVIGPNGTGKSTILCAICLGLGGEPKLLGRADDIATFIMHEKTKACIEIELAPFPNQDTHTIRRVIEHKEQTNARSRMTGTSKFYINDEPVSAKRVRELVQDTYHISVDNLCTFLPQDRVGNFSGFNAQDLLCETEKSMSSSKHLYETHMRLIQMEEDLQKGGASLESIQDRLKKLEAENERLEREKARMEERELAMEQKDLLEKKYVWLKYDEARQRAVQLKVTRDETRNALRTAQDQLKPLEEAYAKLKTELERAKAKYKTLDSNLNKNKKDIDRHSKKFDTHTDEIEELQAQVNSLEAEQNQAARAVEKQQAKVTEIEEQLADHPSKEEVAAAVQEANEEVRRHRPALQKAQKVARELAKEYREVKETVADAENKLGRLQDEKANRRQKVFRSFRDIDKICQWIDQNRTKFRRPVHGPIACEISPKNNLAAACLEFHVPNATLRKFVVECKEDYDLLYREIREKRNVPINIIIVKNGKLEQVDRDYSPQKMQTLKREHGILGYMDESFTAPDPIMQALRVDAQVHKALIGTDATQESLDRKGLLDFLSKREDGNSQLRGACVFSSHGGRSYRYTSTVSRYSNKPSLSVDDVREPNILVAGVNPELVARLEKELADAKGQLEEKETKLQEAKASEDELTRDHQQVHAQMKDAKDAQSTLHRLHQRLTTAKRKLQEAEELANVDNGAEKAKVVKKIMARISGAIGSLEAHADCHRAVMESTFSTAGVRINQDQLIGAERRAHDQLNEGQAEFNELEQQAKVAVEAFKNAKQLMTDLKKLADEKAPLKDENDEDLPLKEKLDALQVNTVEETEAAIEEANAKINSIDANPDVIRQYEERKVEITRVRAQLNDLSDSKDAKLQEIEQVKKPWESSLENAVAEVNELFSEYMKQLGNAGQIRLSKGDGDDPRSRRGRREDDGNDTGNFKNWGIQIMVQFREKSKLQQLSAQVQSGGERSVSTIMYLMALQELMVSPFRCVDEINQGLDERNERLVFKRIVENSSRSPEGSDLANHSGQYFLITPKLLPNLYDMENDAMTVLFVFNGPWSFQSPTDWNVDAFVREAKRRLGNGKSDDEEEEEEEEEEQADENTMPQDPVESDDEPEREESPPKKRRTKK